MNRGCRLSSKFPVLLSSIQQERSDETYGLLPGGLLAAECARLRPPSRSNPRLPPDPLGSLSFMKGDWDGKQNFNNPGGAAMVGEATDQIEVGIAGECLCEMLSTTLPGRKPTDTRAFHLLQTSNRGNRIPGGSTTPRTIPQIHRRPHREQAGPDQQSFRPGASVCAPAYEALRMAH